MPRPTVSVALTRWRTAGDAARAAAARRVLSYPPSALLQAADGAACLVDTLVAPDSSPRSRTLVEAVLGTLAPHTAVLQAWTAWCRSGRTPLWTPEAMTAWRTYVRRVHTDVPAIVRAECSAWVAALPTAGPAMTLVLLDGVQLAWETLSPADQAVCIATVGARLQAADTRVTWLADQVATLPALARAPVVHQGLLRVARGSAALAARRFGPIVQRLDEARPVLDAHRMFPAIFDLLLLECLGRWGAVPYVAAEWADLLATVGAPVRVVLLGALPASASVAA